MGWFLWFVWSVWFIWFGREQPDKPNKPDEPSSSPRDDRSDFNLIAVIQHLVFSHEIIAFYDEMGFDDEIQFTQEFFDFLGTFDLDGPGWMAQLNVHGGIISLYVAGGKGPGRRDMTSDGRAGRRLDVTGLTKLLSYEGKPVAERGEDTIQLRLVTFIEESAHIGARLDSQFEQVTT
jgi:hypothetical protein